MHKMNATTHRQPKNPEVPKIVDQNLIKQRLAVEDRREK